MTLQELAKHCIALHVYSKDTEDTILRVARLFEERSGVKQLEDIGSDALLKFKTATLNNAKAVTFNGYLGYLKVLGGFAEEEKIVTENPFRKQRAAPKSSPAPKTVSERTFAGAIRHLTLNHERYEPAWFWKTVIRTIFYTGIRRRQLVTIQFKDLNLAERTLRASVNGSKTRREWSIPLHPALIPTLKVLIRKSQEALGRPLRPDDYLFVVRRFNHRYAINKDNPEQMKREQVSGFFKRLSSQINAPIGAHRLRHTTATTLCNPAEGRPDVFAAQDLLGHVQLDTTRIYVHSDIRRVRSAVEQLQEPGLRQKLDKRGIG